MSVAIGLDLEAIFAFAAVYKILLLVHVWILYSITLPKASEKRGAKKERTNDSYTLGLEMRTMDNNFKIFSILLNRSKFINSHREQCDCCIHVIFLGNSHFVVGLFWHVMHTAIKNQRVEKDNNPNYSSLLSESSRFKGKLKEFCSNRTSVDLNRRNSRVCLVEKYLSSNVIKNTC